MINDPLVEEVYKARQRIMDACGLDIEKWALRLRDLEHDHCGRIATAADVRRRRAITTEDQSPKTFPAQPPIEN
jgi:hypothetical protein